MQILLKMLFKLLSFLVFILPNKLNYYLAIFLGELIYYSTSERRKVVYDNLKIAYRDKYSSKEYRKLAKKTFHNIGLILIEFLLLERLDKDNLNNYLEIENEKYLKNAYEDGQGVIIFGAHFSNWELMAAAISLLGYPLNAIAQKQSNLNNKINEIREANGINIIPRGMAVREVYSYLKKGELIYILADQDARNRGWKMQFFGEDSSTFPGAVQFSNRTGAKIVPTFLVRKKWGKYKLKFYEAVEVPSNASKEEQEEILQELVCLTEKVIRKNPTQWLWLHRRWKTFHQGE